MIGQGVLIVSLPLLLVATNIRWAVNSIGLYERGFSKYQISSATGLTDLELKKTAQQLIDYFNSRRAMAQVTVLKDGEKVELFTEREIVHLQDVKNLVQLDYRLQAWTLTVIGIFSLLLVIWGRKGGWRRLAGGFLWGGILTFTLIIILALGAVLGFEQLFLFFHLVSFPNEYWLLDPEQHYLIRIFPEEFFYDAALFIFGATLIEALFIAGVAFGGRRLSPRH